MIVIGKPWKRTIIWSHIMKMVMVLIILMKVIPPTLIQRQSENGSVMKMKIMESPVRKKAHGPGPSGSAEKNTLLVYNILRYIL